MHARLSLSLLLCALSACTADVGSESSSAPGTFAGSEIAGVQSAVQAAYDQRHFYVAHEARGPLHDATAATGSVLVPMYRADRAPERAVDGTALRGSCGVTFVSPRYAITAAHCL